VWQVEEERKKNTSDFFFPSFLPFHFFSFKKWKAMEVWHFMIQSLGFCWLRMTLCDTLWISC